MGRNAMNASDLFWVDLVPYIYQQPHLNAKQDIDQITNLLSLAPQSRILDVACGIGRHALECAQKGFFVTAYDINSSLIDENQRKSRDRNLDIEWLQANMTEFCRPESYDAIINLFFSFGYSEHPETDQQVLKKCYQSLRPGGKLVMQLMGRELIEKWFQPKYWSLEQDGAFVLVEKQLNYEKALLHETVYVLKDNDKKKYQMTTRIHYASQISELLQNTGFKQLQIFGGLSGTSYNENASSLVIVGQKPLKINAMIRC